MAHAIGIDIGGTKIEATVFDADWQPMHSQRVATPHDTYDNLITAISDQAKWAVMQAGGGDMPVGIGIPGLHNRQTGLAMTANIPAIGKPLRADLSAAIDQPVAFGNDCDLFAYSEAILGAGRGYETVFGLILGTGIGGGICQNKQMLTTMNGSAGEVGHIPISGSLTRRFDLPVIKCGCSQQGCAETLASGPGMARLAKLVTGVEMQPPAIAAGLAKGDADASQIMDIWVRIVQELIATIQCTIDPDIIVLGGGLTHISGLVELIEDGLQGRLLHGSTAPVIALAKYGDSSGTRGAALLAARVGGHHD